MYRSHGEDGDSDDAAIPRELPELRRSLQEYSINDIWNADVFRLFYFMAQNTTIDPARPPGRKKQKDRIKFLACVYGYGSEKFPLLILENSANP